jgi:hypothetical protein
MSFELYYKETEYKMRYIASCNHISILTCRQIAVLWTVKMVNRDIFCLITENDIVLWIRSLNAFIWIYVILENGAMLLFY